MASKALQSPFHSLHLKYGGKLVNYANYLLPISYEGQSHIESHNHVRKNAGLFDVSHMLQHKLSGLRAVEFLETLTPTDLQSVLPGCAHLSAFLTKDKGGVIDDTIITRVADDEVYFVSNGATSGKVSDFIKKGLNEFDSGNHDLQYTNFKKSLVALQGPMVAKYLGEYLKSDLSKVFFGNHFFTTTTDSTKIIGKGFPDSFSPSSNGVLISRSGYTGEDGFEISIPNEEVALNFFEDLLAKYPHDIRPIGLAARDSLRLEAGMCLYGNELTEEITPVEASLNWIVSKNRRELNSPRANFNGASHILAQIKDKSLVPYKRVGFQFENGAAARTGYKIFIADESSPEKVKEIGFVSSGSQSPSLSEQTGKRINIGQGYVKMPYNKSNTDILIQVRKKFVSAQVKKLPFVPAGYYKA